MPSNATTPEENRSEHIIVGGILFGYGVIGLILSTLTGKAMYNICHEMVGFRYLLSNNIGEKLLV